MIQHITMKKLALNPGKKKVMAVVINTGIVLIKVKTLKLSIKRLGILRKRLEKFANKAAIKTIKIKLINVGKRTVTYTRMIAHQGVCSPARIDCNI